MSRNTIIQPRILKGFRDFSPSQQKLRLHCINALQDVFTRFGFLPIDTPILEYEEILLGKGGGETDKQVYTFKDQGGRSVAMRFDLTVPFARYVAMRQHELPLPFSRYQIGKVFRGENTQKGRYREFTQCDFDIVGVDTLSADLSIVEVIIAALRAVHIEAFKVHVSHRSIISSLLESQAQEQKTAVMRVLDKLKKIGVEAAQKQLEQMLGAALCERLFECLSIGLNAETEKGMNVQNKLEKMRQYLGTENIAYQRLNALFQSLQELSLEQYVVLDASITRGLDYYTGFVCETFLTDYPEIGSVCSGGRYNTLTALYTTEAAAGVGASIGLDRLLAAAEEKVLLPQEHSIVLFPMQEAYTTYGHAIMGTLHKKGYNVKIYSSPRGSAGTMKDFFKFTDRVEPDFTIVVGSEEFENKTITVRNLKTKQQLRNITLEVGLQFIHEQSNNRK